MLLAVWLVLAFVAGIAPYSREDWLLENALVPIVLAALAAFRFSHPSVSLSRTACVALFVFLLLHEIGAHYTYSLVPYRQWAEAAGWSLPGPASRNHFDRAVHLAYGLLVAQSVAEILATRCGLRGAGLRATTVAWMAFGSMLYELIEWGAATVFGGDLGITYLGTQGDPWDAQKDMALALLGSLLWSCLRWVGADRRASMEKDRHGRGR
ncbi:DUF2238 domain-containing protein [Rhodanobacter umsongensis]|uniref:DUF2238 domain-containing protein n=1 Tax=Rhodanobacter umsongensis TaxID=633153 RepID=A0ABW0JFZ4_9GAMM